MLTRDDYIDAAARGPADPWELVREALGPDVIRYGYPDVGGKLTIDAGALGRVTLAQLDKLGRLFLTDQVTVEFQQEDGPWSEVTPGDPARFWIKLEGIQAELTWSGSGFPYDRGTQLIMRRGIITKVQP